MLKRNVKVAAFGLLLAATLVLPLTVRSQEAPAAGTPPPAGAPPSGPAMTGPGMGHFGHGAKDTHPAVHRSIMMLGRVKFVLEKDTVPDPGNHRAEALKSVNSAIEHLDMALAAEKK
jgi:hypothetical protein